MFQALSADALDQLFYQARSYNAFSGQVTAAQLRAIYEVAKLGPTAANSCPARFVFVVSEQAKARLVPLLSEGNRAKTESAPATVIIGYDQDFHEKLPVLFPHADAKSWFDGPRENRQPTALLNASLQAGYFILAARAQGLDCGPMSGFDHDAVDAEFFAGTAVKSCMVINLGKGDPASIFPRSPRLSFDEASRIL